jgi:hypothetical protein
MTRKHNHENTKEGKDEIEKDEKIAFMCFRDGSFGAASQESMVR